jgi:hypothetical protein
VSDQSLATDLGRIAAAGRASAFDDVRLALLDEMLAAKQAGALGHEAWQRAFEHAATSLRMRVLGIAERALRDAATISRYPGRRLAALLPDAEAADALLHRLLAEGMPLERFEGMPDSATVRHGRALALEEAWEGAAAVASGEIARWQGCAFEIKSWQRPRRPMWIASGVILVVALLLAAWLGGELPAPGWFGVVGQWWWSLPWP